MHTFGLGGEHALIAVGPQASGFFAIGQVATGTIAIGQVATGTIAIGQLATGVIAIGQLATGVVAVGQLARGGFVMGQLAVGLFAFGLLALGVCWAAGLGVGGTAGPGSVFGLFGRVRWAQVVSFLRRIPEDSRPVNWRRRALAVPGTAALAVVWWFAAGSDLVGFLA